ncbi:MAG TPA: transposase, partial [Planctomycetaceae bacterium]
MSATPRRTTRRRDRRRRAGRDDRPETPPAELTDAQWAAIAPLLPPAPRIGRRRSTDMRRVVTAIGHHWRTDCPWRKLPPGFPPWTTVYGYFRRWYDDGTLRKLRSVLDRPNPAEATPSSRQAGPPPARLDPDRAPPAIRPEADMPRL